MISNRYERDIYFLHIVIECMLILMLSVTLFRKAGSSISISLLRRVDTGYLLHLQLSWSWWCTHTLSIRYSDWEPGSCSKAWLGRSHGKCLSESRLVFCTLGSSFRKEQCAEDNKTPLPAAVSPHLRGSVQSRTPHPACWTLKSTSIHSWLLKKKKMMMMWLSWSFRKNSSAWSLCCVVRCVSQAGLTC